jgi:hypothetical protein
MTAAAWCRLALAPQIRTYETYLSVSYAEGAQWCCILTKRWRAAGGNCIASKTWTAFGATKAKAEAAACELAERNVWRMVRLTNGFSKKIENHVAAMSLHFMYYNFCRIHQTLRITPAMAAGVSDHAWEISELVDMLDALEQEHRAEKESRQWNPSGPVLGHGK